MLPDGYYSGANLATAAEVNPLSTLNAGPSSLKSGVMQKCMRLESEPASDELAGHLLFWRHACDRRKG